MGMIAGMAAETGPHRAGYFPDGKGRIVTEMS
jgi:hypothetical protein